MECPLAFQSRTLTEPAGETWRGAPEGISIVYIENDNPLTAYDGFYAFFFCINTHIRVYRFLVLHGFLGYCIESMK